MSAMFCVSFMSVMFNRRDTYRVNDCHRLGVVSSNGEHFLFPAHKLNPRDRFRAVSFTSANCHRGCRKYLEVTRE